MMTEYKKGMLVTLRSGSDVMVVTGTVEGMVEVCWMGSVERRPQMSRVPPCALRAIKGPTKGELQFVNGRKVRVVRGS